MKGTLFSLISHHCSALAMDPKLICLLLVLTFPISEVWGGGATMTVYNKCGHPVLPGILPSSGKPLLAVRGMTLLPNKAYTLHLPPAWSGRIWGRHGCSFDAVGRGRCTGSLGNPQSCKPTAYSKILKTACPKAYSYAYDDPTSIATCKGASYLLTFCPHHS